MIDSSKHREIFDARYVPMGSVIVGLGSIGSRLALHFAELGLGPTMLIDDDLVEAHNIANQAYNLIDIGTAKVAAMRFHLKEKANIIPIMLTQRIESKVRLNFSIVASCVDTMAARRVLLECVKGSQVNELFIDGRMTATTVLVYVFDPRDSKQVEAYEKTLYADEEVNENLVGCQMTQSIGATAQFAASLMTARTIDWLTGKKKVFETIYDWQKGFYVETPISKINQ
jgi:molybdopterin/thiamine biosynthesis adenylyltransferase